MEEGRGKKEEGIPESAIGSSQSSVSSPQSSVGNANADAETSKLSNLQTPKPSNSQTSQLSNSQTPTRPKLSRLKSTAELEMELTGDKSNEEGVSSNNQITEDVPYTPEGIRKALDSMSKTFQKQTERFIVDSDFELKEGIIELKLVNQTLMDLFLELKQDIIDFIRKELRNGSVQLDAVLTAEVKEAKPRTEQEKYNAMVEKNPALKKFRDDLGLDLVY